MITSVTPNTGYTLGGDTVVIAGTLGAALPSRSGHAATITSTPPLRSPRSLLPMRPGPSMSR